MKKPCSIFVINQFYKLFNKLIVTLRNIIYEILDSLTVQIDIRIKDCSNFKFIELINENIYIFIFIFLNKKKYIYIQVYIMCIIFNFIDT